MADDLLERIPRPEEIKRELAPYLRAVDLLKKLLKLAEYRDRMEGNRERKGGSND